eukprot:Sdes_comp9927_c0_seq1m1470
MQKNTNCFSCFFLLLIEKWSFSRNSHVNFSSSSSSSSTTLWCSTTDSSISAWDLSAVSSGGAADEACRNVDCDNVAADLIHSENKTTNFSSSPRGSNQTTAKNPLLKSPTLLLKGNAGIVEYRVLNNKT